jgi:hypothetical protein
MLPFVLALVTACIDGPDTADTTGPRTGTIRVSATTSGDYLPGVVYEVRVDDGIRHVVGANDSVTITALPGVHTVRLESFAGNCSVVGANTHSVTVTAGQQATTDFAVSCVPPVGSVTVTATTTGAAADLDPDGYSAQLWTCGYPWAGCYYPDDWVLDRSQTVEVNGSVTFANVSAGNSNYVPYEVRLAGVAANCTITSPPAVRVNVATGASLKVAFAIRCAASASGR